MESWPESLPEQPSNVEVEPVDNTVRTPVDAGYFKARRRFTRTIERVSMTLSITGAQRSTLDTFYHDTLEDGALPFEWEHPHYDTAKAFRFLGAPGYTMLAGSDESDDREWSVELEFLMEDVP